VKTWQGPFKVLARRALTTIQARLWGMAFMMTSFMTFLLGAAALVWIFIVADAAGDFPVVELLLLGLPSLLIFGFSRGCLKVCSAFRQRMHDLQAQACG